MHDSDKKKLNKAKWKYSFWRDSYIHDKADNTDDRWWGNTDLPASAIKDESATYGSYQLETDEWLNKAVPLITVCHIYYTTVVNVVKIVCGW